MGHVSGGMTGVHLRSDDSLFGEVGSVGIIQVGEDFDLLMLFN